MDIDFKPYFEKYESLVNQVESVFEKVKKDHPDNVSCKPGCSDCCHALFDLTLIEAMYIRSRFVDKFGADEKRVLLEKANKADRQIYKIKKKAFKEFEESQNEVEILGKMAMEKVRCPLLNDDNECDMYEARPLTCRIYGVPTSSNGVGHTCGISGFKSGESYPTINMDIIYQHLYAISKEFVSTLNTNHRKMDDMLVPLSMAINTDYNEGYLGIIDETDTKA